MLLYCLYDLVHLRTLRLRLTPVKRFALPEDPGVAERASRDDRQVAARLFQHPQGVLRGEDVSVARHRDVERVLDPADDAPVGLAAVILLPRAPVHGDHRSARFLHAQGERHRVHRMGFVETDAHLDGDRFAGRFHRRLHQFLCQRRALQQRRTFAVLDDLRHGAAHVEVDADVRAVFQLFRRELQHQWFGTEQLDAHRTFALMDAQQVFRVGVAVIQPLRGDHLREGHRSALFEADAPERAVRHPRQGRQREGGFPLRQHGLQGFDFVLDAVDRQRHHQAGHHGVRRDIDAQHVLDAL